MRQRSKPRGYSSACRSTGFLPQSANLRKAVRYRKKPECAELEFLGGWDRHSLQAVLDPGCVGDPGSRLRCFQEIVDFRRLLELLESICHREVHLRFGQVADQFVANRRGSVTIGSVKPWHRMMMYLPPVATIPLSSPGLSPNASRSIAG